MKKLALGFLFLLLPLHAGAIPLGQGLSYSFPSGVNVGIGTTAPLSPLEVSGIIATTDGFDGVGAVDIDYGSADITDHTFVTDGTGDTEFVVPDDSIGPNEIDSTIGDYDFGDVGSFEIPNTTATTLPTAGTVGRIAIVTDGSSDSDCVTGGGSTLVTCMDNGTSWEATGDSGGDTDWTEQSSPADYLEAKAGGITSNGATLYGTAANTHINLGFGTSVTGKLAQNYGYATVGGGLNNTARDTYSTVGGGNGNLAADDGSTVAGGNGNSASGVYATIGGGSTNSTDTTSSYATIGGGENNTTGAAYATVSGGATNAGSAQLAALGGGSNNTVSAIYGTIPGGQSNTTSATHATVGGGNLNTSSGSYSTIPGGRTNIAAGDYSLASGRNMQLSSAADRTFVFGHSSSAQSITTPDAFLIFPKGDAGRVGIGTDTPAATLESVLTSAETTAGTEIGNSFIVTDTGVVTTGTDATIGADMDLTRTGATGGTINTTGMTIDLTTDNAGSGTHTATGFAVTLDGNADTNYAATFSGGNVGIGITAPLRTLDVDGSSRFQGTASSVLTGTIDPAASTTVTGVGTAFTTELVVGDRITVTGETRTVTAIASDTSLTVDVAFSDNANDTSPDRFPAAFIVRDASGNVDLLVESSGKLGVGTLNPESEMELSGPTTTSLHIVADNDNNDSDTNASVRFYNNGPDGTGSIKGRIRYDESSDTMEVSYGENQHLTVDSDGDVGIGTGGASSFRLQANDSQSSGFVASLRNTSTSSTANGLQVRAGPNSNPGTDNNYIVFEDGDGTNLDAIEGDGAGGARFTGDANGTYSDRRKKTNIQDYDGDALGLLAQMRPVRFNYINGTNPDLTRIGFIAQEVMGIYPQAVNFGDPIPDVPEEELPELRFNYGQLTPVLTKAILQLKAENQALKQLVCLDHPESEICVP